MQSSIGQTSNAGAPGGKVNPSAASASGGQGAGAGASGGSAGGGQGGGAGASGGYLHAAGGSAGGGHRSMGTPVLERSHGEHSGFGHPAEIGTPQGLHSAGGSSSGALRTH